MSRFASDLTVRVRPPNEVKGRQLYVVMAPFVYESDLMGVITVPSGFVTDFASIPRIAWRWLDPEDPCVCYPSVVHDYLYSLRGRLSEREEFTREQADRVLREAMEIAGARLDQRAIVYHAVRMFGGSHWKE